MKRGILCTFAILGICLILVAGCTTSTPGINGTPAPGQTAPGQDEIAVLTNGTYAINASVYQITTGRSQSGSHEIDIYITARNTGTTPIQLRWFSRITGANGVSYGGVGVSHAGSGAETGPLEPGSQGTPRDYIVIGSDVDYKALANGATLEVFFVTEPLDNQPPVSFSTEWILDPSVFT